MNFINDSMTFFELFTTIFAAMALITLLMLCIYFFYVSKLRKSLKPVCYISYKKNYFHEKFYFVCEFCGSEVSSEDDKCPKCAGAFGRNKEYQSKKRAMYQRYLQYLKDQENAIQREMDYINNTLAAIKRFKLMRHTSYNFDMGEFPVYNPAADYEFTCEYCDNKMRGKSTDEGGCTNCGASYAENLELLVREEEECLEKHYYEQYMELKDWEWEQNIRNERRDARIDEKYKVPIKIMEKNGKYIALVIISLMMLSSIFIAFLILKFR